MAVALSSCEGPTFISNLLLLQGCRASEFFPRSAIFKFPFVSLITGCNLFAAFWLSVDTIEAVNRDSQQSQYYGLSAADALGRICLPNNTEFLVLHYFPPSALTCDKRLEAGRADCTCPSPRANLRCQVSLFLLMGSKS